jgi:two-component system, chemotaxis family, sensor kinase CheA
MSIDLSRFLQTFFEESFEGLDVMESALLQLTPSATAPAVIHDIFRAAHSIKGGAGTFGLTALSGFTHHMETLLDQMRAGQRAVTSEDIEALLLAVDALRHSMTAARDGGEIDAAGLLRAQAPIESLLAGPAAPAAVVVETPVSTPKAPRGWCIDFQPHPGLFASGNDPLRIFRELETLGTLQVEVDAAALPPLAELVPEQCYLRWRLRLTGEVSREAVAEAFAWVEDECLLYITPLPPPESAAPAANVAVDTAAPVAVAAKKAAPKNEGSSLRVGTEKVDALINLVGELVITQAMLQQTAGRLDPLQNEQLLAGLSQLDRHTRHLQEAVMSIRMLPVDFAFSRFPRLVRDLAAKLGKQVTLEVVGGHTELDKGVIEKMVDPLTHLIRNSLDHGLETPEERRAAGKSASGSIRLSAAHQGGHIVMEVADDGRGLDRAKLLAKARKSGIAISETASDSEVWNLIFAPGFSTAAQVTDVSGRGVGMDVVKKNIESLGGAVDLQSTAGAGMRVIIRLPLTLAILDGMSVRVGREIFIVPLSAVVESLQPADGQVKTLTGDARVVKVRNEFVPMADLSSLFDIPRVPEDDPAGILVVIEADDRKVAARVDELVGQQQVVIKSLEANYRRVRGISGATILGDGHVALILDCAALVRQFSQAPAVAA